LTTAWKFRIPGCAAWRVTDDAQLIEAMRAVWEIVPLVEQRLPLTEEEIHDCFQQRHKDKATERRMIVRAIERAHGIT
tara:strand:- start:273 stop:506 length:234 start_codon:yes stop_codon:yes gene_type:complete